MLPARVQQEAALGILVFPVMRIHYFTGGQTFNYIKRNIEPPQLYAFKLLYVLSQ
jgi:hypothetical protein